jgi:cytochrome oxidase Cu insertion factor (SCO1/SenC/PrrC family)
MIKAIELVQKVDIKDSKILPVFITVDPERDDIQVN